MINDLAGYGLDGVWVNWAIALAIVLLGGLALATFKAVLYRRLARLAPLTENRFDDVLLDLVGRTTKLFMLALPALGALAVTVLPPGVERIGRGVALVICLVQAGIWGSRALRGLVDQHFSGAVGQPIDPTRQMVAKMLGLAARVILWTVLILVALDNFGVNITALIAGLGVGGVAVALATQNILGDLFASVSIMLDEPFVPGDFIVVGDFMGTVEHIGVKTTRVRSLGGEQIVFSNNDLLQSRLRNFKRMTERRVLFRLGVVYQTPPEKLEALPEVLRAVVEAQEGTRFDRAHFAAYGDFALTFEVVYYLLAPEYNRHMDVQQTIFLEICRRFAALGVEFAYPTQTLFVQGAGNGAGGGG
jgi:small-conductance mechanosensitive channel